MCRSKLAQIFWWYTGSYIVLPLFRLLDKISVRLVPPSEPKFGPVDLPKFRGAQDTLLKSIRKYIWRNNSC
jgi:hypothetical protein